MPKNCTQNYPTKDKHNACWKLSQEVDSSMCHNDKYCYSQGLGIINMKETKGVNKLQNIKPQKSNKI